MSKKDYYSILGLSDSDKNLSFKDFEPKLKKEFKKLARKYHPDKYVNKSEEEQKKAEEKFKDINEAYQVLGNEESKLKYDRFGTADGSFNMDLDDMLRNMADSFFGGSGFRQSQTPVGENIVINLHIYPEDIYNRVEKEIKYNRQTPCSACDGTGFKDKRVHNCQHCGGSGVVRQQLQDGMSTFITTTTCPHCGGSGMDNEYSEKCTTCSGSGFQIKQETVKVKIDDNWLTGNRMVMQGYGGLPKFSGGVPGDLIISVIIRDDGEFKLGNNLTLHKTIDVPVLDCLTGVKQNVKTIDGKTVAFTIPVGTRNGDKFSLKGKGMMYGNNFGDLVVTINQVTPKKLTSKESKLINELKNSDNFTR